MPSRRPKTSLRRSKRPSRAAKTAKMTPKTAPRHDFEAFWEPKWRHVGTKIASKSTSCQKSRKALWYWKSCYFSIELRSLGPTKTIQNRSKIIPKLKSRWEDLLTRMFSPFYVFFRAQDAPNISNMAPQRRQDGSRDVAKTLPRPPRSSQDPSKIVQDAFKTAQDEPKTLQEAFKSRQDRQNDPKIIPQALPS